MNKSTLLTNKKILIPIALFLAISIFMIILSIISFINRSNNADIGKPISYIDEITGEKVETTSGVSNGAYIAQDKVPVMGLKQLLDKGMSSSTLKDLNNTILEYTKKSGIKNSKISYYKESYKKISENPNIYTLKIAINDAENILYGRIIYKSVDNYDIELYRDKNLTNRVHIFTYCSVLICPPEKPKNNTPAPGYAG